MDASTPPPSLTPPPPIPPPARVGLAWASLVLGLLGLLAGVLVVGALFGLLGLILGMCHLRRRQGRNGIAWAGMTLSVIGIAMSIAVLVIAVPHVREKWKDLRDAMAATQSGRDSSFDRWQGVLAPDLTVTTLDGEVIKLSELKGKRVVLDFWATWCPPCVKEIPHFIRLRKEVPVSEVVIVGISSEDVDTLKSFVKAKRVNYAIASADNLPSPYKDVLAIPTTFFIDRQGVIRTVFVGYHEFEELKTQALAADFVGEPKQTPDSAGQPESEAGQTGKKP